MSDKTELEQTERMNLLLDFYAPLLTDKQNQVLKEYYEEDLSLAEIADSQQTSRSAVHDLLKRCEKILVEYENKLHLLESYQKRYAIYQKMNQLDCAELQSLVEKCMKTE